MGSRDHLPGNPGVERRRDRDGEDSPRSRGMERSPVTADSGPRDSRTERVRFCCAKPRSL